MESSVILNESEMPCNFASQSHKKYLCNDVLKITAVILK